MRSLMIVLPDGSELAAELYDNKTAEAFAAVLPQQLTLSRWGEEYYGRCDLNIARSTEAREVFEVGELAFWAASQAFCIFFGPTPVSHNSEPRGIEPLNPMGKITSPLDSLRNQPDPVTVKVYCP